jgi:hypothetical protein
MLCSFYFHHSFVAVVTGSKQVLGKTPDPAYHAEVQHAASLNEVAERDGEPLTSVDDENEMNAKDRDITICGERSRIGLPVSTCLRNKTRNRRRSRPMPYDLFGRNVGYRYRLCICINDGDRWCARQSISELTHSDLKIIEGRHFHSADYRK